MGIDSEDKRRSVAGIPPVSDGTIDDDDRRHIAGYYRGIVTAEAPETEHSPGLLLGVY